MAMIVLLFISATSSIRAEAAPMYEINVDMCKTRKLFEAIPAVYQFMNWIPQNESDWFLYNDYYNHLAEQQNIEKIYFNDNSYIFYVSDAFFPKENKEDVCLLLVQTRPDRTKIMAKIEQLVREAQSFESLMESYETIHAKIMYGATGVRCHVSSTAEGARKAARRWLGISDDEASYLTLENPQVLPLKRLVLSSLREAYLQGAIPECAVCSKRIELPDGQNLFNDDSICSEAVTGDKSCDDYLWRYFLANTEGIAAECRAKDLALTPPHKTNFSGFKGPLLNEAQKNALKYQKAMEALLAIHHKVLCFAQAANIDSHYIDGYRELMTYLEEKGL
jgi:hypothetical protein